MNLIEKYFTSLSSFQIEQFKQLEPLYRSWNDKINVISRKDIDQLYLRHVLHSLAIAKYMQFDPGQDILDVGTGGGFPGIPLAIIFPETNFVMLDSIKKKTKVVEGVMNALNLNNTSVITDRIENFHEVYDFVVCRAVAPMPQLIHWTKKNIVTQTDSVGSKGLIALKGGDLSDEMNLNYQFKIIDIGKYFDEDFFISKRIVHLFYS